MIEAITVAILAIAGLSPQLADHPSGARRRAEDLAGMFVAAGHYAAVDPYLVAALAYLESGYSDDAVSSVGATGLLQVHPAHWGRDAIRLCLQHPEHCSWWMTRAGAKALGHYVRKCGSELRASHAYRTGRCGPVGKRARLVIQLRNAMRDGSLR